MHLPSPPLLNKTVQKVRKVLIIIHWIWDHKPKKENGSHDADVSNPIVGKKKVEAEVEALPDEANLSFFEGQKGVKRWSNTANSP